MNEWWLIFFFLILLHQHRVSKRIWHFHVIRILNDTLQWRHKGRVGAWYHQPPDCLLNRLFRCRSKKTSKLRVTGLCVGNSPVTREFPAQMARNVEGKCFHLMASSWHTSICEISILSISFSNDSSRRLCILHEIINWWEKTIRFYFNFK